MKTSILALPQQTVYVTKPLQEAGPGHPANRELGSRIDTAAGAFQTALDNADAKDLPKINGSGVSLVKLPQEAPVAAPILGQSVITTSIKNPEVTAAAMGSYAKETTSGGSQPAEKPVPAKGGLAQVQPSSRTAVSPSADPASSGPSSPRTQPASAPASVSLSATSSFPVTQQPEPEPEVDPGTSTTSTAQKTRPTSRPAHMKDATRSDTSKDPTAEPSYDTAVIMVPPAPPVPPIPVMATALLVTVDASSRVETPSRSLGGLSDLHRTRSSNEAGPTVPDASNVGFASPGKTGFDTKSTPESHAILASAPRQIAAMSRSSGLMEPALHRVGNGTTTQLPSMTTLETSADAGTAPPVAVGGLQVDPGLLLPRDSLPPVKAAASIMIGNPAQAATQQVMPALVSLATRTDGSNELTVSLHPNDLGQVEVHLVRGSDGTTAITITASNPATLQELSQNVHHLHAALDAASVPVDGRTMSFVTTSTVAAEQNQSLSGRGTSSSQDGSGGTSGGQDRNSWQNQPGPSINDLGDDTSTHRDVAAIATRRTWQLNGLNITA